MARPPDVKTFKAWFQQTEKESLPLLVKDFKDGKLKNTSLFQGYRKGAKLIKNSKIELTSTLVAPTFDHINCITSPHDIDTVVDVLSRNEYIEANVKLELEDIVGCDGERGLKELLAELLVGTSGFKNLDNAIDYLFIGGDSNGLYFNVKCYTKPITEDEEE